MSEANKQVREILDNWDADYIDKEQALQHILALTNPPLEEKEVEKLLLDHINVFKDERNRTYPKIEHYLKNGAMRLASHFSKPQINIEEIIKLAKIPSDAEIEKAPFPKYANAYYQGKFDLIMDLKQALNKDLTKEN